MMPAMEWIYEKAPDPITLDVYPLENATSRFVMLDCETPVSQIESTQFACQADGREIKVGIGKSSHAYELVMHCAERPSSVVADGKTVRMCAGKAEYDAGDSGWYFGPGCFYGSDEIATLNIKVAAAADSGHLITVRK